MQFPTFGSIKDVKTFIDDCIIGYKTSGLGFKVFLDETNLANASNSKKLTLALKTAWNTQHKDADMSAIIEGLDLLIFDIWGIQRKDYETFTVSISSEQYELQYQEYGTSLISSHKGLIIEHTKEKNSGNTNYYLEMFLRLVLERATEREKALSAVTG